MPTVRSLVSTLSLAFVLGAAACGGSANDCDKAVDKVHSCNGAESFSGTCTGDAKCTADCILSASCSEIVGAGNGESNDLSDCVDACNN